MAGHDSDDEEFDGVQIGGQSYVSTMPGMQFGRGAPGAAEDHGPCRRLPGIPLLPM